MDKWPQWVQLFAFLVGGITVTTVASLIREEWREWRRARRLSKEEAG